MKNKKTPSLYGTEANFIGLAKEYNSFGQIDRIEEVKIVFAKPLASNQTKGTTSDNETEGKKKENSTQEKEEKEEKQ